jgi:diguanylate cyclase (GGDEF)-like protein/putative nucleotidyltransferase with HDIG domain
MLLAASERALEDGQAEQAAQLALSAQRLSAGRSDLARQATGLHMAGRACVRLAQYKNAVEALEASSRLRAELGDQPGELACLLDLSRAYRATGESSLAGACLNRSLSLSRELGRREAEADALNGLAAVSHGFGDKVSALEHLQAALVIRRETGDVPGEINCLNNLGILLTDKGDYTAALETLLECHDLIQTREAGSETEANCFINLGNVYQEMSQFEGALTNYQRAMVIAHTAKLGQIEVIALTNLAETRALQGSQREAIRFYQEVLVKSREMGFRATEIDALEGLARAQIALGHPAEARRAIDLALELCRVAAERGKEIRLLLDLGETHSLLEDQTTALERFKEATALAEEHGSKRQLRECHERLSSFLESIGEITAAFEHYRAAHRLERELFTEEGERQLQQRTSQFEFERSRAESEALRQRSEDIKDLNGQLEERVRERTRELEEAQVETATCLALAAEYRDDNTGQHTYRVGHLSALLAAAIGLPAGQVELIRIAARLHDVGKIGIADRVLLKPDRLDADEYDIMKAHTTIGAEILAGGRSPVLHMAQTIALHHHERWNGDGYPQGLSGEAIPVVGRIVAIADVYDALTSARPYKPAWTPEEAVVEIERQSGQMFDPNFASLLRRIVLGQGEPSDGDTPGSDDPSGPLTTMPAAELRHWEAFQASPKDDPTDANRAVSKMGDPRAEVDATLARAWALRNTHAMEFLRLTEEALGTAITLAYRRGVGYGRRNLGYRDFSAAHYERALAQLSEALEIGRELEDHILVRDASNFLGAVCTSLGDYTQGVEYVQSTLHLSRRANDLQGVASALTNLGLLHHHLGQDEAAVGYHHESVRISHDLGDPHREAVGLNNLGLALIGLGRDNEAIETLLNAQPLATLIGDNDLAARVLINLSEAYRNLGEGSQALRAINQALGLLPSDGEARGYGLMSAGLIHASAGNQPLAVEMLKTGLGIAEHSGSKSLAYQLHKHLSGLFKAAGRVHEALEHHELFYSLEREVRAEEIERKLRVTSAQREIERSRAESEIYRLRNVELARALASLQEADRLKSQFVKELNDKSLELDRQTKIDALTGIHNRRYLEATLAAEFARCRDAGLPLSVVIIDVDHFKDINDRFSHQVGDQVLKAIAGLILKSCRGQDLVARYGGEEFVIAMPGTPASQALVVCERLRRSLEAHDWSSFIPGLSVTISAGLSDDPEASDHEKLLHAADSKLYKAKRNGRNQTCM